MALTTSNLTAVSQNIKMEKKIFLTNQSLLIDIDYPFKRKFSRKKYALVLTIFGALLIANGLLHIVNEIAPFGLVFGLIFVIWGIPYFGKALLIGSKHSPYIGLDNDGITLKNSFFRKSFKIQWSQIQLIEFNPYKLNFRLSDNDISFSYNSNPEESIEIKEAIRETSESMGIKVYGG